MNDFEGMSEQDVRILKLEAALIHSRAEMRVYSRLIIGSMRDAGLSKMDGLAMDEFFQREARKEIRTFLPALADQDAARAAKIDRILKVDGPQNENQPPSA